MSEPREVGTSRAIDPAFDAAALTRYYRWHAPLYDATRWSFLFGRAALIRGIALHRRPRRILEVGCGTGAKHDSKALRYFVKGPHQTILISTIFFPGPRQSRPAKRMWNSAPHNDNKRV